jgi:hypothetical protein
VGQSRERGGGVLVGVKNARGFCLRGGWRHCTNSAMNESVETEKPGGAKRMTLRELLDAQDLQPLTQGENENADRNENREAVLVG